NPGRGTERRGARAAPLADDRAALAEGMDLSRRDRRQADGGLLAVAPSPDGGDAREPGPRRASRGVDEELPPGGALRRVGPAPTGARRARAARGAADEREPARERRCPAPRSALARFPRIRRLRAVSRRDARGIDT